MLQFDKKQKFDNASLGQTHVTAVSEQCLVTIENPRVSLMRPPVVLVYMRLYWLWLYIDILWLFWQVQRELISCLRLVRCLCENNLLDKASPAFRDRLLPGLLRCSDVIQTDPDPRVATSPGHARDLKQTITSPALREILKACADVSSSGVAANGTVTSATRAECCMETDDGDDDSSSADDMVTSCETKPEAVIESGLWSEEVVAEVLSTANALLTSANKAQCKQMLAQMQAELVSDPYPALTTTVIIIFIIRR